MGKKLLCHINQLTQVMSENKMKSTAESLQLNSSWVDGGGVEGGALYFKHWI